MLWRRLAATLIDAVVTAIALFFFVVLTWRITFLFVPLNARALLSTLIIEGFFLAWLAFTLLCPTIGQRMMDLQVTQSADGTRPSPARRALRAAVIVLTGPVGLAVIFVDPQRRTLWDRISGTQVTAWEWEETGERPVSDWRVMLLRLAAYLIDVFIISIPAIPTVIAAGAYKDETFSLIWIGYSMAYFTLFVPTPGQRLVKLRALSADGKPAGALRRLARGILLGGLFLNSGSAFSLLLTTALLLASKQYLTPWDYVSRLRFVRETRTRKVMTAEKPVSDTDGKWLENAGHAEKSF